MTSSTSDSADFPPWTCETRIGITLIAEAATLSCISVVSLLVYLQYQVFKYRRLPETKLIRSHLDLYLLCLFLADFIQAAGGMMDIKWVALSGVLEGRYCIVQGFVKQIGDVGVALFTLAISIHTFAEIVLRWQEPRSFTLPKIVLPSFGLFLFLISTVGYIVHRGGDYYGNTVYWCWITKDYVAEAIGLQYGLLWLTAALDLMFYLVVFLILKRYLIIEKTLNGRYHAYITSKKMREELRRFENYVPPHRLLYFPAVYIITVVPLGIVRIRAFVTTTESVPFPVTVLCGMLFSASGFSNVLVYTLTRPGLLRPVGRKSICPPNQAQVTERSSAHIFLLSDEINSPSRLEQVALPMRSSV